MVRSETKQTQKSQTILDSKERWTHATNAYCGDVSTSLRRKWELDHYLVQILTGHGHLRAKPGFRLVDNPCVDWCDVDENYSIARALELPQN